MKQLKLVVVLVLVFSLMIPATVLASTSRPFKGNCFNAGSMSGQKKVEGEFTGTISKNQKGTKYSFTITKDAGSVKKGETFVLVGMTKELKKYVGDGTEVKLTGFLFRNIKANKTKGNGKNKGVMAGYAGKIVVFSFRQDNKKDPKENKEEFIKIFGQLEINNIGGRHLELITSDGRLVLTGNTKDMEKYLGKWIVIRGTILPEDTLSIYMRGKLFKVVDYKVVNADQEDDGKTPIELTGKLYKNNISGEHLELVVSDKLYVLLGDTGELEEYIGEKVVVWGNLLPRDIDSIYMRGQLLEVVDYCKYK